MTDTALWIVHTNLSTEAFRYVPLGYEPIECSIGGESIVGSLVMDHHGENSHREGVAVRAYLEYFGAKRTNPHFVTTGAADADACFAIAALAGLLPHPSRAAEFEKAPPAVKLAMTQDLSALARLINVVDVDPIGVRLEETENGRLLLAWNQMSSSEMDACAFYAGVDRWRALLGSRPPTALIAAAAKGESDRVAVARQAKVLETFGHVTVLVSDAWGFDVWYAEHTPIIIAITPRGNITVGVRSVEIAERLLGQGGLKNVFPLLQPAGWGGREAVGGSPRGVLMSYVDAVAAAKAINDLVGAKVGM